MKDLLQSVVSTLKAARLRKGLSQRALAVKVGVPQSHVSKIESGAVDLQTSSLIEFARALDLEVMIVPRQTIPAVQAIQRASGSPTAQDTARHLSSLDGLIMRLERRKGGPKELRALKHAIDAAGEAIFNTRTAGSDVDFYARAYDELEPVVLKAESGARLNEKDLSLIGRVTRDFRRRDDPAQAFDVAEQRPAYSLDEDGDD